IIGAPERVASWACCPPDNEMYRQTFPGCRCAKLGRPTGCSDGHFSNSISEQIKKMEAAFPNLGHTVLRSPIQHQSSLQASLIRKPDHLRASEPSAVARYWLGVTPNLLLKALLKCAVSLKPTS